MSKSLLTDNTMARREEVRGRGTANTQLKTKVVGASPSPDLSSDQDSPDL